MSEQPPAPTSSGRPLFEQILEVAVYAPLGAALRVAEELPTLAAEGRALAGRQLDNARVVGRFAAGAARRQVVERLRRRPDADAPAASEPAVAEPAAAPPRRAAPARGRATAGRATAPAATTLAVPGYDELAASQVLPLLAGLSNDELEAVRRHEQANRGRRTILGRISQIEQERSGGTV